MVRVCSRSHAYRDNSAGEILKIFKSHSAGGRLASVGLGSFEFPYMHDLSSAIYSYQRRICWVLAWSV